jgi:hypothetical protein
VRGKLAFADIDETAELGMWLDAVYAAYADAPHEVLVKLNKQMVIKEAMIDPEEARKTWGVRPEHVAMAGNLGRGTGLESGNAAAMAPKQRQRQARTPGFAPVPTRRPGPQ